MARSDLGAKLRGALVTLAACLVPALASGEPPKPAGARPAPARPAASASTSKATAPKTAVRAPAPKRTTTQTIAASRVWHTPTPGKTAPLDKAGRPMLVLQGLNIPDRVELSARSDQGGFSAEDLDRAARIMREPSSGNEHPIDPRLLDFVYRIQTHFKAHEIRIISAYRTPHAGKTSNHGKGRAMDLVVPGATDEEVATFARDQGFCGVGVYPVSGFVHVDVRERSFFWVDNSGPGKRNRTRGILGDLAHKTDARALARGEQPVGPFVIASDVDAAVGNARAANAVTTDDDDEDFAPGDEPASGAD